MTEIQQESDFKTIAIGDRVRQIITNIVYCFKARKPAYNDGMLLLSGI